MPPKPKKAIADGAATVRQVTEAEAPRSKVAQASAAFDLFDAPPASAPSLEPVVAAAVNEQRLPTAPGLPPVQAKQRKERESLFNNPGKAKPGYKYGGITVGSGRSFTAAEMLEGPGRVTAFDLLQELPARTRDATIAVAANNPGSPVNQLLSELYSLERVGRGLRRDFNLQGTRQGIQKPLENPEQPYLRTFDSPDRLESATAIAEQVMQGTPLEDVVVAPPAPPQVQGTPGRMPPELVAERLALDGERRGLIEANRRANNTGKGKEGNAQRVARIREISASLDASEAPYKRKPQQPPTSTPQVSSYLDPSTVQGQRAAEVAAQSQGMGAAGAGIGSGGGTPPRRPTAFADQPEDFGGPPPIAPPLLRNRAVLQRDQPPHESSAPPILPEELKQRARIAGKGLLSNFKSGWKAQAGPGDRQNYSDSVIGDTFRGRQFPELEGAGPLEQAAFLAGRVGGDVTGYGTRKLFWNLNPEDALGTATREAATWAGLNGRQAQLARYTGATALGLVSANYNPFNIGEGGRSVGFSAVNPNEDDPRKTDNPVGELLFDRMMLGRTGRLLPWEQFHEERPDVSYEKYAKYQDYIRGPSALGMFKATADGIDGPEARMMGYRVQPEAVAAALAAGAGVIAAFKYGGKGR